MGEPTDSADRIEYAVRYEAPESFAGIVAHIRSHKSIAEGMARQEMQRQGSDFRCTVVQRTASFTEWEAAR